MKVFQWCISKSVLFKKNQVVVFFTNMSRIWMNVDLANLKSWFLIHPTPTNISHFEYWFLLSYGILCTIFCSGGKISASRAEPNLFVKTSRNDTYQEGCVSVGEVLINIIIRWLNIYFVKGHLIWWSYSSWTWRNDNKYKSH